MTKARKPSGPDHRPITPAKVEAWVEGLEKGQGRPGFLQQLAQSHRELYERIHGKENTEVDEKREQLSLF